MQLFCTLAPPQTLTAHPKNVTFSKTQRGCRQDNLVSTRGVTQCEPPLPPPPPLKNPRYATGKIDFSFFDRNEYWVINPISYFRT